MRWVDPFRLIFSANIYELVKGLNRYVYSIYLCIFPLMVCSGMIYSVFALFVQDLGATRAQTGLVFSLGAFSAAISAPLLGRLSDRIGRRPVLLASMIVFSVTFILYSQAKSYIDVYAIQLLEGIGWAAMGASAVALIMDIVTEKERGTAIGMYNATWNMGWVTGPVLGGFLAEKIGFRQTFLIASLLILVGLVMTAKVIKTAKTLQSKPSKEGSKNIILPG